MDLKQITDALDQVFNGEQARVVFWNDPDGEFTGSLPDIALEGVAVIRLDEVGALEVKVRIEQEDPASPHFSRMMAKRAMGRRDRGRERCRGSKEAS